MAECLHMPDFAGETCPGCGDEIDQYGNTANDFNSCSFPDCGCDGARLCMAGNPSELAGKYNGEGMYHTPDPAARMAFVGAYCGGEFDAAQGMSAGTAKTPKAVEGEARQPGPVRDAPEPRQPQNTPNPTPVASGRTILERQSQP